MLQFVLSLVFQVNTTVLSNLLSYILHLSQDTPEHTPVKAQDFKHEVSSTITMF